MKKEKINLNSEVFSLTPDQKKLMMDNLENADVWISKDKRPEVGEVLIGKLLKIEQRHTKRGKKTIDSELATILTESGTKSFFITQVIENRFDELQIKEGDIIGLKYLGYITDAKNPYHKITVTKL